MGRIINFPEKFWIGWVRKRNSSHLFARKLCHDRFNRMPFAPDYKFVSNGFFQSRFSKIVYFRHPEIFERGEIAGEFFITLISDLGEVSQRGVIVHKIGGIKDIRY